MSRIVTDIVSCENQIHQFFLNQKVGSLLKRSNIDKEKGISPVAVFRVLVTLAFTGKNLFRTLEAGASCGMAKDTVYRFLNSVNTNWRRFLLLLSSLVIGDRWHRDYVIDGIYALFLCHLYRAMAFLGEEFEDQKDCTPSSPGISHQADHFCMHLRCWWGWRCVD